MRGLRKRRNNRRYGAVEALEARQLLTSNWQNPGNAHNVDDDVQGIVGFDDANLVIAELQHRRVSDPSNGKLLSATRDESEPFIDVDGDGYISPIDLVQVLNNFFEPELPVCTLDEHGLQVFTVAAVDRPAEGAETARYDPSSDLFVGTLKPDVRQDIVVATSLLDSNLFADIIEVSDAQILVYLGSVSGTLDLPLILPTGDTPVAIAVGDYVGGPAVDIVVGLANGSLDFFEGDGQGAFAKRADQTIDLGFPIQDIAQGDFDGDGDLDLAIGSNEGVVLLSRNDSPLSLPPIVNGDFSNGLNGWLVDAVGHGIHPAGSADATNGRLHISENHSFLTSVQQEFVIPPTPRTLSFDLIGESIADPPLGSVPDAFEVSLLREDGQSLLPTIRTGATSFLNVNSEGQINSSDVVTVSGEHISVDLSALEPSTLATLVFDLVGGDKNAVSNVTIDNVIIEPTFVEGQGFTEHFIADVLDLSSIVSCHANEDPWLDLFVRRADNAESLFITDVRERLADVTVDALPKPATGSHTAANQATRSDSPDAAPTFAKFFVVDDQADGSFRYGSSGQSVGSFLLAPANSDSRGATTSVESSPLWVVDGNRHIYVYDTDAASLAGAWYAHGPDNPQGVATDGTDVWIVDDDHDRVYRYSGAAAQLTGQRNYDSYFELANDNADPSGLATDGLTLWVTDDQDDVVYVYDISGELEGSWQLAPDNSEPSGVTIDPNGGTDIWVVDATKLAVFRYANGAIRTVNSPIADSVFQLDSSNASPSGIADPVFNINIGEVAVGDIADPDQVDEYIFRAVAGQWLFFDKQGATGRHSWNVSSPSGIEIDDDFLARDMGPIEIIETGDYKLEVHGGRNVGGEYQFQIWDATPLVRTVSISDSIDGEVSVPGSRDIYSFMAEAGQRLYFDTQGRVTSSLFWSVISPSGIELADDFIRNNLGPIELSESGTYTLEIDGRGDGVADYQVQIWDSTPTIETINQATTVSGIRSPFQVSSYSFFAETGQNLLFDVSVNAGNATAFTIVDPSGSDIVTDTTVDRFLPPLSASGTYTVVARRMPSSPADSSGEFEFRVQSSLVPSEVGTRDSQGTDFWVAFPPATIQQNLSLYISSEQDTQAIVTIPGIEFVSAIDVQAGKLSVVDIPSEATLGGLRGRGNDLIENKGVRISSEREITVYPVLDAQFTSDAYLGLPVDAVGTDYFILDYPASQIGLAGGPSQMTVVATQDSTTVTITPSVDAAERESGMPFEIALDAGQTYLLKGGNTFGRTGLSGTHVNADKPITVLAGHPTAFIPVSVSSGDHIIEQLPPTDAWGRDFVTVPLATRSGGDTFRFVASVDGTTVKVNGDTVATLDRGGFHELLIEGGAEITSNEPILVAQFANSNDFDGMVGDPFMMLITPHEQFRSEYTIGTPDFGFQSHFVNVLVDERDIGSVSLDGAIVNSAEFLPIGNGRFYGAQISVTPGEHRFTSPSPIGVFVYGFGEDDSYGYPGGTALAPVALVTTLSMTPAVATVLADNTHTVTTRVTDINGDPLVGVRVDFDVVGANEDRGFAFSDSNGLAAFTYVGDDAGTDTVEASVGPLTDSVTVDWITAAPDVRITSPENGSNVASGTNTLITGQALPGTSQGNVVAVTINGTPVDTLDAAGNFFTTVPITLGGNAFSVTAIDQFNQAATVSLQLNGLEDPSDVIDELRLSDVTTLGSLAYTNTTFNRATNTLYADARLNNDSTTSIAGPVLAAYEPFRPISVELANPDGTLETGKPFVSFDAEILSNDLASGSSSEPIRLAFENPFRERVDFDVQLLIPGNTAPEFTSAPVATAFVDKDYVYEAAARDQEQAVLDYALEKAPSGMTIDRANGKVGWTPTTGQLGSHQVAIRVEDGFGGSATQSFQLEARDSIPNRSPRFTSVPVTQIDSGDDYVYRPSVFDPDGDVAVFSFELAPNGAQINRETGEVSFSAPADGTVTFRIRAEDGNDAFATQEFSVSVGSPSSNGSIPRFVSTPVSEATVDTLYVYFAQASDDDGDNVTLSLVSGPEGLVMDATSGRIDFTPTETQIGPQAVLITASDGNGGIASQSFVIEVSRETPNAPPTISSIPPLIATRNESYEYQIEASDPEGDTDLTYSVIDAPVGLSIEAATGEISWTPNALQIGLQTIEIGVSDSAGAAGYQRFAIDVRDTNVAPEFQTTPITSAEAGDEYRYDSLATDSEDKVTYRLVEGPFGMTIGSLNGIVFWKSDANDAGNHPVTLRATDERGLSTDQSFEIAVGADTQGPDVVVHLSNNLVVPGDRVRIDVSAFDSAGVASLELTIDGVSQALDPNQGVFYSPTNFGLPEIIATATDPSGNIGTGTAKLRVIDLSDTTPPEITISSPAPGAIVNYLTDIVGSVIADDLEFYRVQVAPFDQVDLQNPMVENAVWQTIAEHSSEADGELLATFDPTLLRNDSYAIRVLAQDFNGNIQVESQRIDVEGLAKIGEFSFEAVDLAVPLAGIPIEITRRYSSYDADISGDFGYGWSLGLATGDIRETVGSGSSSLLGFFTAEAFQVGTRVFLTNPEGQRVSFTFQPFATPGLLGPIWHPHFEPDPGVYDSLEVEDVGLQQREDGSFGLYLFGFNYNPNSYTLVTKDQTRYTFNQFADTELSQITDRDGVTLSVDNDGIRSSTGEEITWKRDALGRIEFITDPDGNEVHYDYTPGGDLWTVTNQVNDVTTMGYLSDPSHFLESIEDARGNQVLNLKYDDGRLEAQLDAFGNASRLIHDIAEQRETIFDLAGNPTTLLYDDRGNVLEETDAVGNTIFREYNDPQNPDLETRIIDKRGFFTDQQFDQRGNLLHIFDMGHIDDPFDEPIQTSFTYNASNDVTSVTDGRKNTTVFRYDGSNLDEIENARGDIASFTYYGNGDVETFTDFRGNTTDFRDYKSGQPRLIVFADGTEQRLDYNQFGQTTYDAFFEADGTLVQERRSEFDAAGRLIKEIAGSDADGSKTERRLFYEGDLLDWEIIVHPDSLEAGGNLLESPATPVTSRHSSITDYEYDAASRMIRQIDAEGGVIEYRYDQQGNRIALRDPVGNITTWLYDALNRPIEERDPLYWDDVRTSTPELEALSPTAFFELVAPVSLNSGEDPLYDDPSGASCATMTGAEHVILTCYDAEGNQDMTIDRNGRRREFEYEFDGELAEERWYSLEGDLTRTMSYGYDAARNMDFASDPDSNYVFTYDSLNQLDTVDNAGTPRVPNIVLDYQFDAQGNPESVRDNLGVTVASQYNDRNLLDYRQWFDASGNDAISPLRVDFLHNAAGRISDMFRYSDLEANELVGQVHRGYDVAGRSNTLSFNDAVDSVLAGYDFGYDELGRVDRDLRAGISSTYGYDLTGQLTSATRSNGNNESFSYDANGNRSLLGYMTGVGNRLETDGNFVYSYDGEGNRVSRTEIDTGKVARYEYDHRNRLVRVTEQEVGSEEVEVAAYTYDALNRRIVIETAEAVTITVYDREQAWADFDGAGEVTTRYLYDDQIDFLLANAESDNPPVFVNTDLLGSVVGYVSYDGALLSTLTYQAFGELDSGTLMGRFGFTGRERDSAIDEYYYRARLYDAAVGQFANEDPLRFGADDSNLFRYVFNSPFDKRDPTGEATALEYAVTIIAPSIVTYSYAPAPCKGGLAVIAGGSGGALTFLRTLPGVGTITLTLIGLGFVIGGQELCATAIQNNDL